MRRLWQACAGPPGSGRLLRALAAAIAVTAVATLVAAAGSAVAGDSGTRFVRALPHYAAPALAAGWLAAALAAFHLRSLALNPTGIGTALRTAGHLCAPPLLWLAAMHAGAWFEWQVRRTPIAYGTDWFYAEMYHEYIRDPGGMVLTVSVAAAVTTPLVAVLVAWLACACRPPLKGKVVPRRDRLCDEKVQAAPRRDRLCNEKVKTAPRTDRLCNEKVKAAPRRGRLCSEKIDAGQS